MFMAIALGGSKPKSRPKRPKPRSKPPTHKQRVSVPYNPGDNGYPYFMKESIATRAELKFYRILRDEVGARGVVLAKIRLADIFTVASDDYGEQRTFRNKIDRNHVDFLICDQTTLRPILGVELDDQSHQRQDRKDRDYFVDEVFAAAYLPLVRFPVRSEYDRELIASTVQSYLRQDSYYETSHSITEMKEFATTPVLVSEPRRNPQCPKCGNEMVLRTSTRSTSKGQQFWGCSTYPKCRGILKVQPPPTP
jgi:predicted RNA-binding Zn-ribbon protein involved in translation (DUF1610 family)